MCALLSSLTICSRLNPHDQLAEGERICARSADRARSADERKLCVCRCAGAQPRTLPSPPRRPTCFSPARRTAESPLRSLSLVLSPFFRAVCLQFAATKQNQQRLQQQSLLCAAFRVLCTEKFARTGERTFPPAQSNRIEPSRVGANFNRSELNAEADNPNCCVLWPGGTKRTVRRSRSTNSSHCAQPSELSAANPTIQMMPPLIRWLVLTSTNTSRGVIELGAPTGLCCCARRTAAFGSHDQR